MKERLDNIESLQGDEYILAHNKWDTELGDYMRCAEKFSATHRGGLLDFSPTVGQWLKKRAILRWILRWHDGKVPDTRNLLRAARRHLIDNPLQLTRTEVESRLVACINEIYTLRHQAPALRQKHLRWRLGLAKRRGDELAIQELTRIMQNEARGRRQRNINSHVKSPRGRAVFRVTVSLQTVRQHMIPNTRLRNRYSGTSKPGFPLVKELPYIRIHGSMILGH